MNFIIMTSVTQALSRLCVYIF